MNFDKISQSLTESFAGWGEDFVNLLPNLIAAFLTLVLFWLIARVAKRIVESAADRATRNDQVAIIASRVAYIAVLVAGLMVALDILELEKTVTSMLAGAGIVGLALGFAFQDLATNLMSGLMLATSEPLRNGDLIRTGEFLGTVESVHLRYSIVRTFEGQLVRIPNKTIFENPLVNYTKPGQRRVDVETGVSFGADLEQVRKVAVEAVEDIEERNREMDVEFYLTDFGEHSINFSLRFWIDYPEQNYFLARSKGILRVKQAFDENGITIPFPIRTLDFGAEHGTKLSEMLSDGTNGDD